MNEHSFIKSVHRKLPPEIYRWKINDRFEGGVADAWYCGCGGHLFVEYKFIALPSRPTTIVRAALSAPQKKWLSERTLQGIPIAVIVGSDVGGVWFDSAEEAAEGIPQDEFLRRTERAPSLARRIGERIGNQKKHNPGGPRKSEAISRFVAEA